MSAKTIRVSRRGDIVQVDLLAPLLIGDAAVERMGEEVTEVIDAETVPLIVMNFEHVKHISSMMLGTLIALFNRVGARGGQIRLAALRERHRRMLAVVGLDGVFEVHPTPEQAVASLTSPESKNRSKRHFALRWLRAGRGRSKEAE